MEKEIKLASKLYECRDSVKSLAKMQGNDYFSVIKPYVDILEHVSKKNEIAPLQALLHVSKSKTYLESGMAQMLFMAVTVEIIKPSETVN